MSEPASKSKRQSIGCAIVLGIVVFFAAVMTFSESDQSNNGIEFVAMPGLANYAMVVPANAKADELVVAAKDKCGEQEICMILGWQNKADMARAFPMTDNEVKKLVFNFSINRTTGHEEALWNCVVFPAKKGKACLSKPD